MFGGRVFQQTVGIAMGLHCTPLLADLFLYSYEADFILPNTRYVYLHWPLFSMKHSLTNSLNLSFSLE
jgi:hypothetical protein